ncbi:RdgB/HAM1 family non-canonical purine NTP pyrophosphatase [Aquaspirillum serpens]|uniref:RdgB/HAM1 family non-canonical purine NTP pyrophosphatase n=1 Tax=Aquaspirillum serpens TaxID=190 RepID=UPI0004224972|nr:RdgB/HAM1 family non-canonical purine NTP pyrophosphatase [Aquaspirillum serpens]
MLTQLLLASNNAGKLKEFSALLAPLGISQIVPQGQLGIPEAEEPYGTFIENALAKARHASRLSGLPALADDSGLCVDALGGAPGVLSARYAGEPKSDQRNNEALLAALDGTENRQAHYYCVLVLVRSAEDPQPIIADAVWRGHILPAARGEGGFGYDPLFQAQGYEISVAEMASAEKNRISHRAQALAQLVNRLQALQK